MTLELGTARVDQVNQHIRAFHFLQGRSKSRNEIGRKISDEADGVVNDDLSIARQSQAPAGRIQRCEHSVFSGDRRSRKRVQQSRLPGVRVAHYRNDREVAARTPCALYSPARADLLDLLFQKMYSIAHAASIDFELCLAGASPANSTHQSRHLDAGTRQSRQHVLQLGALNLNFSLSTLRALGTDVEDQ